MNAQLLNLDYSVENVYLKAGANLCQRCGSPSENKLCDKCDSVVVYPAHSALDSYHEVVKRVTFEGVCIFVNGKLHSKAPSLALVKPVAAALQKSFQRQNAKKFKEVAHNGRAIL